MSKMSDLEQYNLFVSGYLGKLPEDHDRIAEKKDFKKMCQKYGKAWIDYLNASFSIWEETQKLKQEDEGVELMSWEEFLDYNGIPDYYIPNLKKEEVSVWDYK